MKNLANLNFVPFALEAIKQFQEKIIIIITAKIINKK